MGLPAFFATLGAAFVAFFGDFAGDFGVALAETFGDLATAFTGDFEAAFSDTFEESVALVATLAGDLVLVFPDFPDALGDLATTTSFTASSTAFFEDLGDLAVVLAGETFLLTRPAVDLVEAALETVTTFFGDFVAAFLGDLTVVSDFLDTLTAEIKNKIHLRLD